MSEISGVTRREVNIAQVASAAGDISAAMVFYATQGPIEPTLVTNTLDFEALYGTKDYRVSFAGYCAEDFFEQGNQLWCKRPVNADASYGALMLALTVPSGGSIATPPAVQDQVPEFIPFTFSGNPQLIDPTKDPLTGTTLSGLSSNYALIHSIGPTSRTDVHLSITSTNMYAKGLTVTATLNSTTGTLAAGTYEYLVTAVNGLGETGAVVSTDKVSITIAAGTTNAVTLAWPAVPGAVGYKVYGRTSGGFGYLTTVTAARYLDKGTVAADTNKQPSVDNTFTESKVFNLRVFDYRISKTAAQEEFTVSLLDALDAQGNQLRMDHVVNIRSKYIRVINYAQSYTPDRLCGVYSLAATPIPAGASGSLLTSVQLAEGWSEFEDKQRYNVRVLINAGYATPAVQQAMLALANKRMDCVAFLDLPATAQTPQAAVDYVNSTALLADTSGRAAFFASDYYSRYQVYVPTSGANAAMCSAATRFGSWYPFAGLRRGRMSRALSMRELYTPGEQQMLKNAQINYVRKEIGYGLVLSEQKTQLRDNSPASWISCRMMIDEICEAAVPFLRYFVHEPDTDYNRRQIQANLSRLCQYYVDRGGLKDFLVVCDGRVNNVVDTSAGKLNVYLYLVPTLPTEQIVLTGVISPQGVDLNTLVGNL